MTSNLNYKNVKEILEEICYKNGLIFDITGDSCTRTYTFFFKKRRSGHSLVLPIHVDCMSCNLTLLELLTKIRKQLTGYRFTTNNFDWSYYMKKAFTKADLKNGDVIKRRDGSIQIVCVDIGTCICQTGNHYDRLIDLKNDLMHTDNRDGDIMAVRRPLQSKHCCFDAFDLELGELVYERSEPVEMTLEEICEALGKDIKIVKK